MKNGDLGFTLIELMIVVAIIAILAAIGVPLYLNYTSRAEATGAVNLAGGLKTGVAEYFNTNGDWPTSNTMAGAAAPASIVGKYVKSVEVGHANKGRIVATFCAAGDTVSIGGQSVACKANKTFDGQSLTFSPLATLGSITWFCYVSDQKLFKLIPADCRHLAGAGGG